MAVVTIVTERYRSQYALIYTSHKEEAVTDKAIEIDERVAYNNPAVSMSTEDIGSVLNRKIQKEIVTNAVDVVQTHCHTMLFGGNIAITSRSSMDTSITLSVVKFRSSCRHWS